MATTMKDVARQAGVDVSTVSLAINNDPRIRIETRERILLIARDLCYRKNLLARGLRSGKSFTIGAIVDSTSSAWNEVLVGAQTVLGPRDYHLLLDYTCETNACGEAKQMDALKAKRIDGFLIAPANDRGGLAPDQSSADLLAAYQALRDDHIPFLFVDRYVPGVDADLIASDNASGVQSAVEYLHGLGHKRIGYVYMPGRMNSAEWERLHGYELGMRSAELKPARLSVPSCPGPSDAEAGYATILKYMQSPSRSLVTALIFASDAMTLGGLQALAVKGIEVPRDISVLSIGGSPMTEYLTPAVTTVTTCMREIGVAAARVLYDRIQGDGPPWREIRLPTELTLRASCGPP